MSITANINAPVVNVYSELVEVSTIAKTLVLSSPVVSGTFEYVGSGGLVVTTYAFNKTEYEVWYSLPMPFTWTLGAYLNISQDFAWNTGDIPLNWYQIQSAVTYDVSAETTGLDPDDPNIGGLQGMRMQRIAAGRSVSDLCSKLKETSFSRPIKWKFETIKRYNRPIYTASTDADYDTLIAESWCEVPTCYEFCLDTDQNVFIGVKTKGVLINRVDATGSLYVEGSAAAAIVPQSKIGVGGVELSGAAGITSTRWMFVVDDETPNLIANGFADHESSRYTFIATGSLAQTGSVAIVSSRWGYDSSGAVYTGNSAVSTAYANVNFVSTGIGLIAAGIATSYGKNYHYITDMSGELEVSGTIELKGDRLMSATGELAVDGACYCRADGYRLSGVGGLVLGGLCELKYSAIATGSIVASGIATSFPSKKYIATGGVQIDGTGAYLASGQKVSAEGSIAIGGACVVTSSFLGRFDVPIGATTGISNYGMATTDPPASQDTIVVDAPNDVSTNCGYSATAQIELRHNLADSDNIFANFLVRSGNTIPNRIFLSYNLARNVWQWHQYYTYASESWDVLFEFFCTDKLGDSDLGETAWRFNGTFRQKTENVMKFTKFSTAFDAATIRNPLTGIIIFAFAIDAINKAIYTTTATVFQNFLILEDRIGMFLVNGLDELNFYISEVTTPSPTPIYPLSDYTTIVSTDSATTNAIVMSNTILGTRATSPIGSDVPVVVGVDQAKIAKPSPYRNITRNKVKSFQSSLKQSQESKIFNK